MNNNLNDIALFKNFLTNYDPKIPKINGLKINDKIKMLNSNKPKKELVALVYFGDKPIEKKSIIKEQNTIFPFLCDI